MANTFYDDIGEKRYQIRDLINCKFSKVIYMLSYPCNKLYIGKTKKTLKIQRGEQMNKIKGREKKK